MGPLQRPVNMCKSLPLSPQSRLRHQRSPNHGPSVLTSPPGRCCLNGVQQLTVETGEAPVPCWRFCVYLYSPSVVFCLLEARQVLNLAHKAFVIVPLFFPTGGDVSDFQRANSAFSEPPIVPVVSPTGGGVSDFQKAKSAFSELPIVLHFCPHKVGASDLQKAKRAFFQSPNCSIVFSPLKGGPDFQKANLLFQGSQSSVGT